MYAPGVGGAPHALCWELLTFWWQVDSQRMLALGLVVYCVVTDLIPVGKNEESFFLSYETLRVSILISEVRVITHNNL